MRMANSSTGPTRRFLTLLDLRMMKVKQLELLVTMENPTRNGR
jgi:hypothetical protein